MSNIPRLLVFAGPNGSGKSTAKSVYPVTGTYINADDIKARSGIPDLAAAEEAERLREYHLEMRKDFTFETVLSTDRNMHLLRRAKDGGYHVEAIFVLTVDAEINVMRVRSRVKEGGHDVPADKIRSRYVKSLANIPELATLSDICTVLDNSCDAMKVIYRADRERNVMSPNKLWPLQRIEQLIYGPGYLASR